MNSKLFGFYSSKIKNLDVSDSTKEKLSAPSLISANDRSSSDKRLPIGDVVISTSRITKN